MAAPEVTSRKLINVADPPIVCAVTPGSDAATRGVKGNKDTGSGIMGIVHLAVIFPGAVTRRHVV